jgi:anti-anti-sigma regulatory factor
MFAIVTRGSDHIVMAGDLVGATVIELDRALRAAGPGVVLDLSELRLLDHVGAACLRGWRDEGVVLTGVSPRVSLLIQSPASLSDPDSTR